MYKKLLLSLYLISFLALYAEEVQTKRAFTVTTIALDAEDERLDNENIDINITTLGGDTE